MEVFKPQPKAGAMGKDVCVCHGKIIGSCFNITPWSDCCKKKCHNYIWRHVPNSGMGN
jgi:hypothetical protein